MAIPKTKKRKGEYGQYMVGGFAEGDVPFFRFVMNGTEFDQAKVATAKANVKGAVEYDEQNRLPEEGGVRSKFVDGEQMAVKRRGVAIVKVGVGGVTEGNYVESDASGQAVEYVKPTVGAEYSQSVLTAILNRSEISAGRALETKAEGEYARIDLDER